MTEPFPIDQGVITRKIKALKAVQPIGDIFVATIDFKLIQQMTWFDVRRRIQKERDVEKYLRIQRPLNDKRVEDLKEYVNFIDATFPTSIILAIESDYVTYDEKKTRADRLKYKARQQEARHCFSKSL